jgi:hypothetical protein
MMRSALGIAATVWLAVAPAAASPSGDLASLARALPSGWKLTTTATTLVVEARSRVRVSGRYLDNAPHTTNIYVPAAPSNPQITLALVYRTEPRWSAEKLASARAANAPIFATLATLRARYRIAEIRTSKGRPLPATPDEQQRLAEYEREYQRTRAQLVKLPRCTLDNLSIFDGEDTYAQLGLVVDPPSVMREAFAVVELVKRRCH